MDRTRRDLLRVGGGAGAALVGARWLAACTPDGNDTGSATTTSASGASTTTTTRPAAGYGALQAPDANGLRLPEGFTSRVVATCGEPVPSTEYVWPANPDGAATFEREGGGWIHVVNHESGAPGGGVSRLEFDEDGEIVVAGRILLGTSTNCAGGATPWATWLSCEETLTGRVHECDPTGATAAVARPAMGVFSHEAVAVDPDGERLYLTEDMPDGALYRFTPTAYPDLAAGSLEVLTETAGALAWAAVPDASAATTPTRNQVPDTKRFAGGEGICLHDGSMYFTTKYDNRVWRYEIGANTVATVYDEATSPTPELSGVDNIIATSSGELLVAEDGGNMQIVLLADALVQPVLELTGVPGSEITGPCFSPDGSRLYFSSQRNPGRTYEVTGPWRA